MKRVVKVATGEVGYQLVMTSTRAAVQEQMAVFDGNRRITCARIESPRIKHWRIIQGAIRRDVVDRRVFVAHC